MLPTVCHLECSAIKFYYFKFREYNSNKAFGVLSLCGRAGWGKMGQWISCHLLVCLSI